MYWNAPVWYWALRLLAWILSIEISTILPGFDDNNFIVIDCSANQQNDSDFVGIENSISAITEPIQAGKPTVRSIKIEGGPYYTRLFKLNVEYFGGDEGQSLIQWYRTTPENKYTAIDGKNSAELFWNCLGATKRSYQPTVADIGCRLEVKYTPVRSDGVTGLPVFVVSKAILKGKMYW